MPARSIPDIVISRLPLYLQALQHRLRLGEGMTSSKELAEQIGLTAAQIRKDLSLFGGFGKQGTGYKTASLIQEIKTILHMDRQWPIVLAGAGDLGRAITRYQGFSNQGFSIVMIFDNNPKKIGEILNGIKVQDIGLLGEQVSKAGIKIGMLTVPMSVAQAVAEIMVKAGVKAILNYAPVALNLPENIHVEYVNPILQLQHMTYNL
jgi:redox-sensing transcriptional repressor